MISGLPRNALELLDALVDLSEDGEWIGRASLELHMAGNDRTIRRNTRRLLDWALIEYRPDRYWPSLRATALGRSLIEGHHTSQRPLEALCAK